MAFSEMVVRTVAHPLRVPMPELADAHAALKKNGMNIPYASEILKEFREECGGTFAHLVGWEQISDAFEEYSKDMTKISLYKQLEETLSTIVKRVVTEEHAQALHDEHIIAVKKVRAQELEEKRMDILRMLASMGKDADTALNVCSSMYANDAEATDRIDKLRTALHTMQSQ